MNPMRVFAKLAARVPPPDMQPGSTGEPPIDSAHAAALCAGMPEHMYRAALARYAGDETVMGWLGIKLWMVAMERAQKDRWRTAGKRLSRCGNRFTMELLETLEGVELESFEQLLEVTDGVEYTRAIAHILVAEVYDGRHWAQPENWVKRAAVLGVSKSAYFETWHKRLAGVGMVFEGWCSDAFKYVARQQIEREDAA